MNNMEYLEYLDYLECLEYLEYLESQKTCSPTSRGASNPLPRG
jgi:hypothetical protein